MNVVYTAWDAEGWCLYVGCTSTLGVRMRQHSYKSEWHRYMARLDVSEPLPYSEARDLERRTIDELGPQFNVNHNGWVVGNCLAEYDDLQCDAAERGDWRTAASAFACKDASGPYGNGALPLTDEAGYRAFVAAHVNPSIARAYGLDVAA